MTQRITAKLLLAKHACQTQIDIFACEWPDGAEVTLESCRRAVVLGLDLSWAAECLLSASAEKVYQAATATAEKAYQAATATAEKAFQAATAPAGKAFQEATASAKKAYQAAKATAFYAAWLIDHHQAKETV